MEKKIKNKIINTRQLSLGIAANVKPLLNMHSSECERLVEVILVEKNIPVFNLPILKSKDARVRASPMAGASPILPAGRLFKPTTISPFRNVPVVITTDELRIRDPSPATQKFRHNK